MSTHLSQEDEERLIRAQLGEGQGFFVEVGAHDPREGSQTWHLENAGWTGVLIEPQPDMAEKLRAERKASVFAVACSSPQNSGRLLPLHVAGPMSSLDRVRMSPGALPNAVIDVPIMTLDEILLTSNAPSPIDFLSIDIEGHELEALRGFDFAKWQPRLILLEDRVANHDKLRFMRRAGYRLIRHVGFNGWYVPAAAPETVGIIERVRLWRKYYGALPIRIFRDGSRRRRQPCEGRRADRDRGGQ